VPQVPDSDWLSLSQARTRALAFFADSDPAGVERAIVEANYDGKIETRGRCEKRFGHPQRVLLQSFIWDPELISIRWSLNFFVHDAEGPIRREPIHRALGSPIFTFTDVQLKRRDFEKWLEQAAVCDKRAIEISPVASNELATARGLTATNKPAPVKTASYSDVRAAVQKRGPAVEAELLRTAREELAPKHVSRQQIRDAIAELFGRPGRTGRPKSRMRKSP
jgi:hypothetical protein